MKRRMVLFGIILLLSVFVFYVKLIVPGKFECRHDDEYIINVDIVLAEEGEIEVLKTLSINSDIIDRIRELKYYKYFNDPCQTISGIGIMITYSDKSYEIIQQDSSAYYSDGDVLCYGNGYFNKEEFDDVLYDYLDVNAIN